jgi:tetratricopeptide (TPR) repeat protein
MNTIFRIDSIQQMDNHIWEVKLCVTSDDDPQLKELTDYMRQDITGITGHKRVAQLMIRMSEWIRAKEIYESPLSTSDNNDPADIAFLHHQLGYMARQRGDLNDALQHYQQVLALDLTHMPEDDRRLVSVYTNIALVLYRKGDLDQALQQYNRALNIEEHANQPDKEQLVCIYT